MSAPWNDRVSQVAGTLLLAALLAIPTLHPDLLWVVVWGCIVVLAWRVTRRWWMGVVTGLLLLIPAPASIGPGWWGSCNDAPRTRPNLPVLQVPFLADVNIASPDPGCVDRVQEFQLALTELGDDDVLWLVNRTGGKYYPWPKCVEGTAVGTAVRRISDTLALAEVQVGKEEAKPGQLFEVMVLVTDSEGDQIMRQKTAEACAPGGGMELSEFPSSAQFKDGVTLVRRPDYWQTIHELLEPPEYA